MKEITSTSFGLVIANILPGLVAVFSLSNWIIPIKNLFDFSTVQNLPNILIVSIFSLILGLEITLFRWLIYEKVFCFKCKINKDNFKKVTTLDKITILRVMAEEYYRYHQFWGNMSIVFPLLYVSLFKNLPFSNFVNSTLGFSTFIIFEIATIAGAIAAYINYVNSVNKILEV